MDTAGWLTVIGWPVSVVLTAAATCWVNYISRKRSVLSWAVEEEAGVVEESEAGGAGSRFGVEVDVRVAGKDVRSLHILAVQLANTGSETLQNVAARVDVGGAVVLAMSSPSVKGEFEKHARIEHGKDLARIYFDFLNVGQEVQVELLLADYKPGTASVDVAAPGVIVRRVSPTVLADEIARSVLGGMSFGLLGMRVDPTAVQVARFREDARELNRSLAISMSRIEQAIWANYREARFGRGAQNKLEDYSGESRSQDEP